MDISDWTDLNKFLSVVYTKKKFFNEFLYRLNYDAPGIRLVTYAKDTDVLKSKIDVYNTVGVNSRNFYKRKADPEQLKDLYYLYQEKSHDLKFRVEAYTLSIYSNSETFLYDLASNRLKNYTDRLVSVSLVESTASLDLLEKGFTIVKNPPEYSFRVKLREGFQNIHERKGLAQYLQNINNEVKISKSILERLSSDNKYFSGGYLYLNDARLVDLLKLVSPTFIGPTNQIVHQ